MNKSRRQWYKVASCDLEYHHPVDCNQSTSRITLCREHIQDEYVKAISSKQNDYTLYVSPQSFHLVMLVYGPDTP